MILVDSSALIEYYRPTGSQRVRSAVAEVIEADLAAVNGVVQVEVVAFAVPTSYAKLLSDFKVFHWLDLGVTVPATDLIIAASAIRADAVLYHVDAHFDTISQRTDLKSKNLRA